MKTTVLIDGNGLFWRCYKAVDDLKYGGEYGFLRTYLRLAIKFKTLPIVCWDCYCGWRRKIYPKYKCTSGRVANTEEREIINNKRNEFISYLSLLCPNVYHLDEEADDILGYLSRVIDGDIVVYSNDHDMLQLINPRVKVLKSIFNFNRSADKETTDKYFVEINETNFSITYGHPLLIEKYMMFLVGCTSDGITGCSVHKQKIQDILLSCQAFTAEEIYAIGNGFLRTDGMNRRWNDFFAAGNYERNKLIMDLTYRDLHSIQTMYSRDYSKFYELCDKRGFLVMLDDLESIKSYDYK